jgi:hypothetical protein
MTPRAGRVQLTREAIIQVFHNIGLLHANKDCRNNWLGMPGLARNVMASMLL